MTSHLHAGMTGQTRDGSKFEIFAERGGHWFGCVREFADSVPEVCRWRSDGSIDETVETGLDILLPAPVKKYRWVIKNVFGHLHETPGYFSSAEDAVRERNRIASEQGLNPGPFWAAIAKIEGSEVEE